MNSNNGEKELTYFDIVSLYREDKIASYELNLSSGVLTYTLRGEKTERKYNVPSVTLFYQDVHDYVMQYNEAHPDSPVLYNYKAGSSNSWLLSMLPILISIVLLGVLMFVMTRRMNQSIMSESNRTISFGKARIRKNEGGKKVTFADVAGADEEKEELSEIVEFLKDPSKYNALGARIPKGVLLVGPPGTGKTLLAKAVAGEANAPFLSISGSDFLEMYVGVGASRVRDLFAQAKKSAPSIIFIDEIDAVGRHRGAGMGGGHDEREQTLNQMLVEMDGFVENEGVIVIAATNRPDILDPALLRPGRFDRQITVGYPDIKGREEILKVHARNKSLAPDVNLLDIARSTVGFTGADLENLLNEAALLSARRGLKAITKSEIEEATVKVVVGTEKRSHKISEKDKRITAYHEAGHAIATHFLEGQDPVHQVSIVPRGMAGGFTMSLPLEDKTHIAKSHMEDDLVTLLGGRVAEKLVFDDITTGASNDIERASDMARKMVTKYGMSDNLGPITFGSGHDEVFLGKDYGTVRNYSEEIAKDIDIEVKDIITKAYQRCENLLIEHRDKLDELAEYLIAHEKIDGEDFAKLMDGTLEYTNEIVSERNPGTEEADHA
ncbi:MAG: ATP-dependent zinc metalloprotease FtsH [Clostridia bacterium]|nr:ATP-dependent zinc metalloprotease FtsH [Clostridia bacterium]